MQENCLQRISLWLFCYSVHTGLRPGLINLSNGRMSCGMSAQLSLPLRGRRRSDREIWANYASHSWELGLITVEWSTTELWDERTGQLLIYSAQTVIAKVSHCPACLVSPPWETCPPQQHSSSRALLGHVCSMLFHLSIQPTHRASNPTTPHPKGLFQGVLSFPSPPSFLYMKPPESSLLCRVAAMPR